MINRSRRQTPRRDPADQAADAQLSRLWAQELTTGNRELLDVLFFQQGRGVAGLEAVAQYRQEAA